MTAVTRLSSERVESLLSIFLWTLSRNAVTALALSSAFARYPKVRKLLIPLLSSLNFMRTTLGPSPSTAASVSLKAVSVVTTTSTDVLSISLERSPTSILLVEGLTCVALSMMVLFRVGSR